MNDAVRQGDVFLLPVDLIPEAAKVVARDPDRGIILAWGEVTGHAHRVTDPTATLLATESERFLRIVSSGAWAQHEEHGSIAVAPGVYRVVIGREFDSDMQIRKVVD